MFILKKLIVLTLTSLFILTITYVSFSADAEGNNATAVFNKTNLGEYEVTVNTVFGDIKIEKLISGNFWGPDILYIKDEKGIYYGLNVKNSTKTEVDEATAKSLDRVRGCNYFDSVIGEYSGVAQACDESKFENTDKYNRVFICNDKNGKSLYSYYSNINADKAEKKGIVTNDGEVLYEYTINHSKMEDNMYWYKSYDREIIRTSHDLINVDCEILVGNCDLVYSELVNMFNGVFYFYTEDENGEGYFAFCDYDGNLLYKFKGDDEHRLSDYIIDNAFGRMVNYSQTRYKIYDYGEYLSDMSIYFLASNGDGYYRLDELNFHKIKSVVNDDLLSSIKSETSVITPVKATSGVSPYEVIESSVILENSVFSEESVFQTISSESIEDADVSTVDEQSNRKKTWVIASVVIVVLVIVSTLSYIFIRKKYSN